MAAIVGANGQVIRTDGKGNKNGQYILNDAGKAYMAKYGGSNSALNKRNNIITSTDMWNHMYENGMIEDTINGAYVAKGNAGIAERNTASHSSGMDMFDAGNWLTRYKNLGTPNIMTQETLASGSLLSLGGTLA